jgi:DNA-binding transcriptional LysR family regulator
MQIRFLDYFVALAQAKHFARAAEACHVAQPTLSSGIAALEAQLGKRLIVRDRRFVGLTTEGHALLPWAQRLLADYDGLRHAVADEGGPLKGTLRLGVIPAAMPAVGHLVRAILETHPHVTANIRSMTSRQIEQALIEYELDAGLTYLSNEPPAQVLSVPLYEEHYMFATRADAPLGQRSSVEWREVAQEPLCLLHPNMQNRRILDAHLTSLDLAIEPRATADSYVTLLSLVEAGGLSSILPHSYAALVSAGTRIRLIDFVDPARANMIGLVVLEREPRSALARAACRIATTLSGSRLLGPIR